MNFLYFNFVLFPRLALLNYLFYHSNESYIQQRHQVVPRLIPKRRHIVVFRLLSSDLSPVGIKWQVSPQ